MSGFETLRWRDGRLEMLDQRALPSRVAYLPYDSARARGGGDTRPWSCAARPRSAAPPPTASRSKRCACRTRTRAEFEAGLARAYEELAASRPTAVNLFWALARMREKQKALAGARRPQRPRALLEEAHAIREEDVRLNRAMGEHGAALLADRRAGTHALQRRRARNGGPRHRARRDPLRGRVGQARSKCSADETRPFLQGARLTAWELAQDGIPATLIADSAAGYLMSRGEVDAVIVGADRVAANGDVANKIGTYSVAVLAQRHGIPFYVACPLSTIDLAIARGADIPIEERDARGSDRLRRAATGRRKASRRAIPCST